MNEERATSITRARSKNYPGISLREAITRCQTLYEKDGWTETLAETAAQHWGYAGLNGGSRPILSALKQFGLLEYLGSGDHLRVKMTDTAKRILRPVQPAERTDALQEALISANLYASLHDKFPDWRLPSEQTLAARLEREEGIQPRALKGLVNDIKDSIAFLREAQQSPGDADVTRTSEQPGNEETERVAAATHHARGLQTHPMPNGEAYICLPSVMDKDVAQKTKRWIEKVIIPALEFAAEEGGN